MADRVRELLKRLLEWWNQFSPKQKTIIISVIAGTVVIIGALAAFLNRPQYTSLVICETTKEAAEVKDLLESNDITYRLSDDALSVEVLKDQVAQANLVLGANDIPTTTYDISKVTDGGFSTTESDKQKRYILYLETDMEQTLETNEAVEKAHVTLSIPEDDGTLIAQNTASFASVVLELNGELPQDAASSFAHFIATSLGNSNTDNITIIDSNGNLLYSGETQADGTGNASTQFAVKQEAENMVKQEVKTVLLGTNLYDNVEVASNLSLDFSTYEKTDHTYTPADNSTQGVLSSEDIYNSESTGGTSGTPGTDSNTDTTYVVQDSQTSSSTVAEESRKYLPNETITNQTIPAGLIKYDESSLSVTAKKLKVYKEEDVQSQGLLAGTTWDAFKAANADQVKLDVDQDLYSVVAKATGIADTEITIVAYEIPVFVDKEGLNISVTDVVQVVLIIAILGVLAFVVLRSMRAQKAEVPEEELSVENLLQSNPDEELENIEMQEKSDARRLIEKFVDENPEAVASLLRNWLSEDWG